VELNANPVKKLLYFFFFAEVGGQACPFSFFPRRMCSESLPLLTICSRPPVFSYGRYPAITAAVLTSTITKIPGYATESVLSTPYHRDVARLHTDGNLGATDGLYNQPNSQGIVAKTNTRPNTRLSLAPTPARRLNGQCTMHLLEDDHWEQPANLFLFSSFSGI